MGTQRHNIRHRRQRHLRDELEAAGLDMETIYQYNDGLLDPVYDDDRPLLSVVEEKMQAMALASLPKGRQYRTRAKRLVPAVREPLLLTHPAWRDPV